jgi:hypothetical protein
VGGKGVSVGRGVSVGGTEVGVYVGLGRLTYAQRCSSVGVGLIKIAALAGDVVKKTRLIPIAINNGISHKPSLNREGPSDDFMGLSWE